MGRTRVDTSNQARVIAIRRLLLVFNEHASGSIEVLPVRRPQSGRNASSTPHLSRTFQDVIRRLPVVRSSARRPIIINTYPTTGSQKWFFPKFSGRFISCRTNTGSFTSLPVQGILVVGPTHVGCRTRASKTWSRLIEMISFEFTLPWRLARGRLGNEGAASTV